MRAASSSRSHVALYCTAVYPRYTGGTYTEQTTHTPKFPETAAATNSGDDSEPRQVTSLRKNKATPRPLGTEPPNVCSSADDQKPATKSGEGATNISYKAITWA